jgi:hypothetical protein
MGLLTEFLDLGTSLVDVELKKIQRGILRWVSGIVLLGVSVIFLLAGFVLIVAGVYELLKSVTGPADGAFIEGGAILLLALILIGASRKMSR